MKNKPLKPTHTIVLSTAILLTLFSIIGSVAVAGLIPLVNDVDILSKREISPPSKKSSPDKNEPHDVSSNKDEFKKIEFNGQSFKSLVKPKHLSCFNCGVVTAIESIHEDTDNLASLSDEDGLLHYLEAHRENARIIALDENNDNHIEQLRHSEDQHITYLIKVLMQDGTQHVITQNTPPKHEIGDKVRLITGKVIIT